MKQKPKLDEFQRPGSMDEFLDGAVRESSSKTKQKPKEKKEQKLVQLSRKVILDLKQRALDESAKAGRHITDSDLIERAILEYLHRNTS